MSRRARPHRIALIAAAATLAAACSTVLGLNGYTDAIDKLCQCSNLPDCKKTLNAKLDAASESEVRDWLQLFGDKHCDKTDCNTNGVECFYSAPDNCTAKDAKCERSEQCCDFDFDKPHDGAGCCAAGEGTCCQHCLTCAEALGQDQPDLEGVCASNKEDLLEVLNCKKMKCPACGLPSTCAACVAKNCNIALDACTTNQDP